MGYCTLTHIQGRFMGSMVFDETTQVKASSVQNFININSTDIDSKISSMYVTPITGVEALKIVQKICELMTTGDVEEILREQKLEVENAPRPASHRKMAEVMIQDILDGKTNLTDADRVGADTFYNYNVANGIEFEVKKGTRQW
jgi:hypothetical protein